MTLFNRQVWPVFCLMRRWRVGPGTPIGPDPKIAAGKTVGRRQTPFARASLEFCSIAPRWCSLAGLKEPLAVEPLRFGDADRPRH